MTQEQGDARPATLSVLTLTTVVVGSMVGAGVFSLPAQFAAETGVVGTLIAWTVAGSGMLMLALVFQRLAVRRPELDSGIYAYAKEGFGQYLGFFAAFGYWASACVGNVTYWVLIMSTIGAIAPVLGDGDTALAIILSSVGLWLFFFFIRQGVKEAAAINRIVTIAKVIPIVVLSSSACSISTPRCSRTTSAERTTQVRSSPRSRERCSSLCSCSLVLRARVSTRGTRSGARMWAGRPYLGL
jgi:arginine:ornithine antiporter/lysine permease